MAVEPLSPKPTAQRGTTANRLQSPTSPLFLGSNDDQLERAQARAARAAANRRVAPTTTSAATNTTTTDPYLSKEQIVDLFHNCIKLASENKINQKNTWELKLIDHLSEIIKVESENDTETNFQKASCTLEAGVKIYSVRVDSVHSEAYKVLGGINRAGIEDEQETILDGDNGQDTAHSKKETARKISPLSTLESSFEALNVKKFDVAFSVDPLYHQTSAQFDEGGAKGLLLNNLGVYGGCRVLFDSFEVPGKCKSCSSQNDTSDMVDLSFAKESIEQMVVNMRASNEISPTLKEIIFQFDKDNQRPSQTFNVGQQSDATADAYDANEVDFDSNLFGNNDAWTFDHEAETSSVNQSSSFGDPSFQSHEESDPYTMGEPDVGDRFEKVSMFLFQGLGITSKQNAWAGPDHWKYRRSKGSEDTPAPESGSTITNKRTKKKILTEVDIDFTNSLNKEVDDIFLPPKNPKSLLLPANRAPTSNRLPDDCHYQPENLVKLFLLPNVLCLGKRTWKFSDANSWQGNNDFGEALPSWDNESVLSGQYDDGCVHNDVEEIDGLVSQPRRVNKIEVQYDKTSKQVDVHALKETLWGQIQESTEVPEPVCEDSISFRHLLSTFPIIGPAGTPYHDGLFVFDCLFPTSYPNSPPMVYYYSGGLRLNPNLYDCGKVCLSLLGTWTGKQSENWIPEKSTMLQVLVSIQALILNDKPFFNEPGYESTYTGAEGERRSNDYNENVFILSLKTMMYTLRRPPKHFEDFVAAHFRDCARNILAACKAYTEGVPVGSAAVGTVIEDVVQDKAGKRNKSNDFKSTLSKMMNLLITNFAKNGSTDIEQFHLSA